MFPLFDNKQNANPVTYYFNTPFPFALTNVILALMMVTRNDTHCSQSTPGSIWKCKNGPESKQLTLRQIH